MKRIYKTVLTLVVSLFLSKAKANDSEINKRVLKIRKNITEQLKIVSKDENSKKMVNYFEVKHNLNKDFTSEKNIPTTNWYNWNTWNTWNTWNNWNNWDTWSNWNTWNTWDTWSNWNTWNTWSTWSNWYNWHNY